jgi:nitrous oxidase accessory protein NosD
MWNSPLEITYTYDGNAYTNYLGNYWADYGGTDAKGDGIGDTHYSLDSEKDESDDYPLMKPFENYILPTSAPA